MLGDRVGSVNAGRAYWDVAASRLRPTRPPGGRALNTPRVYASATDPELMAWSASGDARAFDAIVTRHGPLALRIARRLVDDAVAAEDLVQEAMVRVWQQAERFDSGRALLTTWLYRIVTNLAIDYRRRRRPVSLPEDFDMPDPAPGAEAMLEMAEDHASIDAAMAALPPRYRMVVALVYEEGLSGAETARLLGLSAKAVERLLARARATLRSEIRR